MCKEKSYVEFQRSNIGETSSSKIREKFISKTSTTTTTKTGIKLKREN